MSNKKLREYIIANSKEHIEKINFENGSVIKLMPSEDATRGKGVRAIPIDVPDHVIFTGRVFDDRIEFKAYNTITKQEGIAPFYFKEGESPAMEHIKISYVTENLIKKVQ